jgi:hypothetical protein
MGSFVTTPPDKAVPRPTRRPRVVFWTIVVTLATVALVLLCLGGFALATRA